ncbi:MAG: glycosyltransferase family 39 protein [Acetobacteraceae bacterium]|nr:glycosyltransferase family 39 protein [Acetobacteraceae bacterium]
MAATLVRVVFGWALGLGVDESYMVSSGRLLRWGYFDHPPASWWMQWGAAHLLGTEAPLAVRAPFILCFALTTWLMYRLGAATLGERGGLWAALALNLSPVFGVTTGTWVLPDGPLDAALLGAALCLVHALPARGRAAWGWWIGAGVCAGLALFSKYTAVLTIVGAFAYLLTSAEHRRWLKRPEPYVAGLIAAVMFVPVIAWNALHRWASFAFQGDRAGNVAFRPAEFFAVLGGEALFVLPWIWAGMMIACWPAIRRRAEDWRVWLLVCLGAPPILVFAVIAVVSRRNVLFHWAAPGYLMLFPLLGGWIAEREGSVWMRRAAVGTVALVMGVVVLMCVQIRTDFLHPVIAAVARHDPDLEGIDWTSLRTQLAERDLLLPGTVVGVPNWRDAGKIAYALGPSVPVVCLNRDARELGFTYPASRFLGRNMLVLALDHPDRVRGDLAPLFRSLDNEVGAMVLFDGIPLQSVTVLRGVDLQRVP